MIDEVAIRDGTRSFFSTIKFVEQEIARSMSLPAHVVCGDDSTLATDRLMEKSVTI